MDRCEVPNGFDTTFDHEIGHALGRGRGNGYDADMNAHSLGKIHKSF